MELYGGDWDMGGSTATTPPRQPLVVAEFVAELVVENRTSAESTPTPRQTLVLAELVAELVAEIGTSV